MLYLFQRFIARCNWTMFSQHVFNFDKQQLLRWRCNMFQEIRCLLGIEDRLKRKQDMELIAQELHQMARCMDCFLPQCSAKGGATNYPADLPVRF